MTPRVPQGSLAFELPSGRIELPPVADFITLLSRRVAPRLQAVFLNGCTTAELGYQIVHELPWLTVICWATVTEDTAARVFAQAAHCPAPPRRAPPAAPPLELRP